MTRADTLPPAIMPTLKDTIIDRAHGVCDTARAIKDTVGAKRDQAKDEYKIAKRRLHEVCDMHNRLKKS